MRPVEETVTRKTENWFSTKVWTNSREGLNTFK